MAWVHFTEDFTWHKPSFSIAYKSGMTLNVKRECAQLAVTKGRAMFIATPRRGEEPNIHGNEGKDRGA